MTEETPPVLLTRNSDNIALITLNRPKANALSAGLLTYLYKIVSELVDNPPAAVVLYGGKRLFSAGADISEMDLYDPDIAKRIVGNFHEATSALASLPRIVIAAITGYALGGGLELALSCDIRIAGESVKLGLPEVSLGILPGGGGTQRLPRLIGASRAKEMILSGRQIDAREAIQIGLVNKVVPDGDVLEEAMAMAAEYAGGALAAQGLAKRAIDEGIEVTLQDGLAIERAVFEEVFRTEDARIGIESFLDNGPGKAHFSGH